MGKQAGMQAGACLRICIHVYEKKEREGEREEGGTRKGGRGCGGAHLCRQVGR